jgi:hypothetical protein
MACCIALALVISAVRVVWFRLLPGRAPDRAGFAPPASRPAPGQRVPAPTPTRLDAPAPEARTRTGLGSAVALSLLAAVAGAGLYAAAHQTLLALGVLSGTGPGPRDIALVTAAALTAPVFLAARTRLKTNPAHALLGFGEAWTLLSALDMRLDTGQGAAMHGAMHGAMRHGVPTGSPTEVAAALAMHGPGLVALLAGLVGLVVSYARHISLPRPALIRAGGSA